MKTNAVGAATTILLMALFAAASSPAAPAAVDPRPPRQHARIDWVGDLHYLLTELEHRHPDLYFNTSRATLDSRAAALEERLPDMDDRAAAIELARLVASIGDPHTGISLRPLARELRRYPIGFGLYDDGLFLLRTDAAHSHLLGARVLRMGDVQVDSALARIRTLIASDNDYFWRSQVPQVILPSTLEAVGVAASREHLELDVQTGDGAPRHVLLESVEPDRAIQWVTAASLIEGEPPLHLSHERKNYWAQYLWPDSTLYIQFNRLMPDPGTPIDGFVRATLGWIDTTTVRAVVIDLRHNGGGNSGLMRPLIDGLRERMADAPALELYTITGWSTFSSAVLNTLELKRVGAVLVGAPTGGRPNHFGEVRSFTLPSSKLDVHHSTRYFERVPGDPPFVVPDIEVPYTFAAIRQGRDPALQVILHRIRQQREVTPAVR